MARNTEWHYLGHAMWLAEFAGLRVLFDPLLEPSHHGGVFVPSPARRVNAEALRPDFVVVSHRHPDHFDVPSLARLAQLDADAVLITADALVETTAEALGFARVARVNPWHRIELDGVTLLTTPSHGAADEWGVFAVNEDGAVYNQIDTVMRDTDDVGALLRTSAAALERPELAGGPELALVRWQPQLEVDAMLAGRIGFPYGAYADLLAQTATLSADVLVPAACGERHAPPYQAMNELVYPVPRARWLRDASAACPRARVLEPELGGSIRLEAGSVVSLAPSRELVEPASDPPPERFVPLQIPALRDPNLAGVSEQVMRARIDPWVREDLAVAIVRAAKSLTAPLPLSLVLEVVYPSARDAYTFTLSSGSVHVARRFEDDYDVLNQVAASMLFDVVEGRRHWGEPLLAGLLRASERCYAVTPEGLTQANVALVFLYYALSYERSQERQVAWQLAGLNASSSSSDA